MELLTNDDVASRSTFPQNADIREISCHLAARVFIQATKEGVKVFIYKITRSKKKFPSMLTKKCLNPSPMEAMKS